MTDENTFVMLNFSVWPKHILERAKSRFQTSRTLSFASKSRMAQSVNKLLDVGSLFRRFSTSQRADARIGQIPAVRARRHPLRMSACPSRLGNGRGVTVNLKGCSYWVIASVYSVLVRIKDAKLEIRIGVARIEPRRVDLSSDSISAHSASLVGLTLLP